MFENFMKSICLFNLFFIFSRLIRLKVDKIYIFRRVEGMFLMVAFI